MVGLSTGILLLRAGYSVTIWAKDLPPNTTSNKAAAMWFPFLCFPVDKATRWGKETFSFFLNEIIQDPTSGCLREPVIELLDNKKADPTWKESVDDFSRPTELPAGYEDGYEIKGLIMDTNQYMDYLVNWFEKLGGKLVQKNVSTVDEAFAEYSLVVNCTGLGSRSLFGDEKVYPVRGQTLKIKKTTETTGYLDEEGHNTLAYIIPRINDVVLGGTAQVNDWNDQVDEKDTQEILKRCIAIDPSLANAEIIGVSVGLRPARFEVRLEVEEYPSHKYVIHNYGHGGSGFTISWGCAKDVVELAKQLSA